MGLGLSATFSNAQLLNENFDDGIPGDWTQWTGEEIFWEANAELGTEGSGCVMSERPMALFGPTSGGIQTPVLDLTTIIDPELTFSTALVSNSSEGPGIPSVSLWYDIGDGWVYIANWGNVDAFGIDNEITTTTETDGELNEENITWVELTYDLSAFADESSIRFSFGGDFPIYAAGWVLVDDVQITGEGDVDNVGLDDSQVNSNVSIYPNPSNGTVYLINTGIQIEQIKIFSITGQEVKDFILINNSDIVELDLTDLEKGVYLISIVDDFEQEEIQRLVID